MRLTFIGDVHGDVDALARLISRIPQEDPIFQVGDFGMGFGMTKIPIDNFHWIRGNHDDPRKSKKHPNYLGDYGYLEDFKMFFCGGALSIDKDIRIHGVSWWPEEEQSIPALNRALKLYERMRPDIVLTHECPSSISKKLLGPMLVGNAMAPCIKTRTAQALEAMFRIHQPRFWIFGHYHMNWNHFARGTHFHCCDKLDKFSIEVP